ncbi:MAG: hypothetical protein WCA04_09855 [Geobacteraceae bacterium]
MAEPPAAKSKTAPQTMAVAGAGRPRAAMTIPANPDMSTRPNITGRLRSSAELNSPGPVFPLSPAVDGMERRATFMTDSPAA